MHFSYPQQQVLGGRIVMPLNNEENVLLYNTTLVKADYCANNIGWSYLWLGATDAEEERVWKYIGTSTPISWEGSWRGGAPNGGIVENCLVMLYGDFAEKWSDIACLDTYYFCLGCEFETRVYLYLKGPAMCPSSPFNYNYILDGERDNRPVIAGIMHSEIYWEERTHSWILHSLKVCFKMYMA